MLRNRYKNSLLHLGLSLFCYLTPIAAESLPHYDASEPRFPHSQHRAIDKESHHPWLATLGILSLNDKFTFNKLEPGFKALMTYNFSPNFYTEFYYLTLRNNSYEMNSLWGVQSSTGNVRPYFETDVNVDFYPHSPTETQWLYDSGLIFMMFGPVIPIIEFDNFFDNNRISFVPQIIFQITKRFSIEFEYSWHFKSGANTLELRLNYAF